MTASDRPPDPRPVRIRPGRLASFALSAGLSLTALAVLVATVFGGPPSVGPGPPKSQALAIPIVDGDPSADLSEPAPGRRRAGGTGALDEPPGAGGATAGGTTGTPAADPPARSGTGPRVVFDQSAQRVWLVRDNDSVRSTYLVSGSVHDNLDPGRYAVSSRSRHAVGFDYSSTMEYMVRFAEGDTSAIGFHDIPVDGQGEPVQSAAELGTATSSGCIRQREPDARELWRFAPVGTTVAVVS